MKIYFIREETTFGPFFSSKKKVREYLEGRDEDGNNSAKDIEDILAGDSAYTGVEEVELDDSSEIFDG